MNKNYLQKLFISFTLLFGLISFASAGKMWLEPASGEFTYKCPFDVTVMIDTEGEKTTTVDFALFMDDSIFAINSFKTEGGVFPTYTSFTRGKAWNGENKGKVTVIMMGTTAGSNTFKGEGKFGTLRITPLIGVKEMDVQLYGIPGFLGDDTNINVKHEEENIIDALSVIEGAHYTFVEGECPNLDEQSLTITDGPVTLTDNENAQVEGGIEIEEPVLVKQSFSQKIKDFIGANIDYVIILLLALIILIVLVSLLKKKEKTS